jgi:uncharacterized protein YgiM (DUF1202 family)
MRMTKSVFISFLFLSVNLFAFDGDSWIVAGDDVRVRSTSSVQGTVVDSVNEGTVVRVISKTDKRDKFLQNDEFGFFWYNAELPNGKKGWIYGKFLYQMNGQNTVADPGIFSIPQKIDGKNYFFGIAQEEAYPVADETGLTGSEIHLLPFFLEEGKTEALLLKTSSVHTFEDNGLKFPYYFKLTNSEGGMQTLTSIETSIKNKVTTVRLNFDYEHQDGGGTFYILAKKEKNYLLITEYHMKEGRED